MASCRRTFHMIYCFCIICRTIWSRDEAFEDRKDRGASARKFATFVSPPNSPYSSPYIA